MLSTPSAASVYMRRRSAKFSSISLPSIVAVSLPPFCSSSRPRAATDATTWWRTYPGGYLHWSVVPVAPVREMETLAGLRTPVFRVRAVDLLMTLLALKWGVDV